MRRTRTDVRGHCADTGTICNVKTKITGDSYEDTADHARNLYITVVMTVRLPVVLWRLFQDPRIHN